METKCSLMDAYKSGRVSRKDGQEENTSGTCTTSSILKSMQMNLLLKV